MSTEEKLQQIDLIKKSHPGNIAIRCFDPAYFASLTPELQRRLLNCMNSGIENPDSSMGCYANRTEDYEVLRPFFECAIRSYHGISRDARHDSNWEIPNGPESALDLDKFGLSGVSMRIRVGRNFADLPLTSAMTLDDRLALERRMLDVFVSLQKTAGLSGHYVSLTPDHDCEISASRRQELIDSHILFKNMDRDRYLVAAGIASDWPHGRGCYYTRDSSFVIWVGEEDHLRIMCMEKGTRLGAVLNRLHSALDHVEQASPEKFSWSDTYGAITTCPTNLGTGMRASVHLRLPHLTKGGSDKLVSELAKPFGLAVRGLGGEHTPIGPDGTVDLSPRARLCITEGEIVKTLYDGIATLVAAERAH